MALHARCVAVTAGARGHWVEMVANALVKAGQVKVEKAKEILAALMSEQPRPCSELERPEPMSRRSITAFGPGKVILLGEHGVVYGHPALAAAISRGIRAWGDAGARDDAGDSRGRDGRAAAGARAGLRARREEDPAPEGLRVTSRATCRCRWAWAAPARWRWRSRGCCWRPASGQPPKAKDVEALALEMEKEFHGTPSGVDHTTSARGTMVLFKKGKAIEVRAPRPVKVLVALVGPRSATKLTVGGAARTAEALACALPPGVRPDRPRWCSTAQARCARETWRRWAT